MKHQNIYKTLLLVIAFALIGVYLYSVLKGVDYDYALHLPVIRTHGTDEKSCNNLSGFINSAIQKANYCATDEDCMASDVAKVPCNCWSLVNKSTDFAAAQQAIDNYKNQQCDKPVRCEPCISKPMQAEIACQSNVCVTRNIYTESKVYVLTERQEYQLGDTVNATIKNNLDHEVTIPIPCVTPFYLLKNYEGKWERYGASAKKDCIGLPLILAKKEQREFVLNLEKIYEHSSFRIEAGAYKILVYYTPDPNLLGIAGYNEAYSDEFTVTAQPLLDARIVGSYTSPGESSKIALSRRRPQILYLTDISEGLLKFDVSDPAKPKLLASTKIEGGGAYAVAIAPTNNFGSHDILVSGYGNSKIALILSASREFTIQDTIAALGSVQDLWYTGHYGIAVSGGPEFELIRIVHDPDAPFDAGVAFVPALQTQRIPTTIGASVVDIAHDPISKKVFLAQGSAGVGVFDLRNLDNPPPLRTLDLEGNTYAVALDTISYSPYLGHEFIYILNNQSLMIVEVSRDGNTLKQRGKVALAGEGADIDVYDNTAAVAEWEKGVEIFDVKDPDNPHSLGVVDTPGRARDVAVQNEQVLLCAYQSTASSVCRKDPTARWHIYVADDRDDLQVIEMNMHF